MDALTTHRSTQHTVLIAAGAALVGLVVATVCLVGGPLAAVALAAVVLGALMFLYAPGFLFALYLLIPFYKGALMDSMPIDLTVLLAGANALQFVPLMFDRQRRAVSRPGVVLWGALLLLILVGMLYAPDMSLAMRRMASWLLLVFLPITAAGLRVGSNPAYVRQVLWGFLGMGVVEVIIGLTVLSSTDRLEVLGANTIAVARAALLVPLMAGLFALRARFTLVRLTVLVLIPASFVVAVASGSRGPILMLGILIVFALASRVLTGRGYGLRPSPRIVAFGLASLVVLGVTASQIPQESLARYAQFSSFIETGGVTSGVDDSSLMRVYLFDTAFDLFQASPLIGVGTAGYATLGPKALGLGNADEYPHNAVLQFAAEYGAVGLAIFLGLIALALFRPLPDDASRALKLLMLFFFLNAMVSGDVFEDRTLWGLLILILLIDAKPATETAVPDPTMIPVRANGVAGKGAGPWATDDQVPTTI